MHAGLIFRPLLGEGTSDLCLAEQTRTQAEGDISSKMLKVSV